MVLYFCSLNGRPRRMLSRSEPDIIQGFWGTNAIEPDVVTEPLIAGNSVSIAKSSELLPARLGPVTTTSSPSQVFSEIFSRTLLPSHSSQLHVKSVTVTLGLLSAVSDSDVVSSTGLRHPVPSMSDRERLHCACPESRLALNASFSLRAFRKARWMKFSPNSSSWLLFSTEKKGVTNSRMVWIFCSAILASARVLIDSSKWTSQETLKTFVAMRNVNASVGCRCVPVRTRREHVTRTGTAALTDRRATQMDTRKSLTYRGSTSCLENRKLHNYYTRKLKGPVTLRNFYSNLQRNTVALQVAEELRGVTGFLGNLQRIFFCCAQRCTK